MAAVSNAYEVAKAGGPHHGLWKNYRNRPVAMLERAVKSLEQQIAEHETKRTNPRRFLKPDVPDRQVEHLARVKWPEEIDPFKTQIEVLRGMIEAIRYGGAD